MRVIARAATRRTAPPGGCPRPYALMRSPYARQSYHASIVSGLVAKSMAARTPRWAGFAQRKRARRLSEPFNLVEVGGVEPQSARPKSPALPARLTLGLRSRQARFAKSPPEPQAID